MTQDGGGTDIATMTMIAGAEVGVGVADTTKSKRYGGRRGNGSETETAEITKIAAGIDVGVGVGAGAGVDLIATVEIEEEEVVTTEEMEETMVGETSAGAVALAKMLPPIGLGGRRPLSITAPSLRGTMVRAASWICTAWEERRERTGPLKAESGTMTETTLQVPLQYSLCSPLCNAPTLMCSLLSKTVSLWRPKCDPHTMPPFVRDLGHRALYSAFQAYLILTTIRTTQTLYLLLLCLNPCK